MNDTGQGGTSLEMFVRRCPSLLHVYTHRGRTWLLVGGKNWENSRLVRAKTLTVNIKDRGEERGREREGENQLLESPEHIISTVLSLHTQGTLEKWGGR